MLKWMGPTVKRIMRLFRVEIEPVHFFKILRRQPLTPDVLLKLSQISHQDCIILVLVQLRVYNEPSIEIKDEGSECEQEKKHGENQ